MERSSTKITAGGKLPYDKFFAELGLKGINHLGQVKRVYLETSGELSIYPIQKEKTKPGLPIYPEMISDPIGKINEDGLYACTHCGNVILLSAFRFLV